jgi:hypothetical protein
MLDKVSGRNCERSEGSGRFAQLRMHRDGSGHSPAQILVHLVDVHGSSGSTCLSLRSSLLSCRKPVRVRGASASVRARSYGVTAASVPIRAIPDSPQSLRSGERGPPRLDQAQNVDHRSLRLDRSSRGATPACKRTTTLFMTPAASHAAGRVCSSTCSLPFTSSPTSTPDALLDLHAPSPTRLVLFRVSIPHSHSPRSPPFPTFTTN